MRQAPILRIIDLAHDHPRHQCSFRADEARPSLGWWRGLRNNQRQNYLRRQSPRQKSFMELSCSPRASARGAAGGGGSHVCRDLAGRVFGSRATQREFFPRLLLTAVPSADLSATRMRRSRPLPKCDGPSSRRAMLTTSRTVVLMSLTLEWFVNSETVAGR